jgi:hypothetical protein
MALDESYFAPGTVSGWLTGRYQQRSDGRAGLPPHPAASRGAEPGGYVVREADGQALAYLYSRDNPTEAL